LRKLYGSIFIVFLLCASKLMASSLFDFQRLRVERIRGKVFAFESLNQRPIKLKVDDELGAGILLATSSGTIAVIDVPGPSKLYLGENTRLYLRGASSRGIWVFSLIKGKIIVKAKETMEQRPPNVMATIKNSKEGFLGNDFALEFTKSRQALTSRSTPVRKVAIPELVANKKSSALVARTKTTNPEADIEEDIEEDVDVEEDIEQAPSISKQSKVPTISRAELTPMSAQEFLALTSPNSQSEIIDQQELESVKIEHDTTTQFEQKIVLRYAKYPSAALSALSLNSTIYNDEENGVKNQDLQPSAVDTNVYDYRYEWKYRKQIGNDGYIFNGWVEYGSEKDLYKDTFQFINSKKKTRPILEFNEVYYTSANNNFDFSVGKKIIKNGFGLIYSPLDDVTPKDLYDPIEKRDLGNWTVQGDFYINNFTLTAAFIPFFLPNRQFVTPIEDDQGNLKNPIVHYPSTSFANFLIKAKTTIKGWDLLLGLFNGYTINNTTTVTLSRDALTFPFPPADQIVVNQDVNEYYPQVTSIFAGFSTLFMGGVSYMDFKVQSPHKEEEDSSFYNALIGYNRKFSWLSNLLNFNDVNFYIEYSRAKYINQRKRAGSVEVDAAIERAKDALLIKPYSETLFAGDSLFNRKFSNTMILKTIFDVYDKLELGAALNIDFNPEENSLTKFDAITLFYQFSLKYKLYGDLSFRGAYELITQRKEGSSGSSLCTSIGKANGCNIKRLTLKLELPF